VEDVEELQRVTRRLAEAVIERSATRAADLIEDAVEHAPALLVFVESLVEEMPQKAAALRDAPRDCDMNTGDRICGRRVVFQEADEVARAGEPASDNARVAGAIDDIIDSPG